MYNVCMQQALCVQCYTSLLWRAMYIRCYCAACLECVNTQAHSQGRPAPRQHPAPRKDTGRRLPLLHVQCTGVSRAVAWGATYMIAASMRACPTGLLCCSAALCAQRLAAPAVQLQTMRVMRWPRYGLTAPNRVPCCCSGPAGPAQRERWHPNDGSGTGERSRSTDFRRCFRWPYKHLCKVSGKSRRLHAPSVRDKSDQPASRFEASSLPVARP